MSTHEANIQWQRQPHESDENGYSRNHVSDFGHNQTINVSASTDYKGDPSCADPEQLLVSALSSCHMLFFLAIAEMRGFTVKSYNDQPIGHMGKGESGGLQVVLIELTPTIEFAGDKQPDQAMITRIHTKAHQSCFIGNSITAEVRINDAA